MIMSSCLLPGCGHCKKAKPEFMNAAAQFTDNNKVLCLTITSYSPFIKIVAETACPEQ